MSITDTTGTTSACAENTPVGSGGRYTRWNYLRVRGEYRVAGITLG